MTYKETIKENKTALMVTYFSMVFEGAITVLMVATMTALGDNFGIDKSGISLLLTVKGIGTVLTIYLSGKSSDKIGRKNVIFLGVISYLVFLIGMVFTKNFHLAIFFALLSGFGHGLMDSPAISMLIDIFGDKSGPAMSFVQVFFAMGGALVTIIASFLLKWNLSWKYLFFILIVMGIFMLILVRKASYPKKILSNIDDEDKGKEKSKKEHVSFYRHGLILAFITFSYSSGNSIINTWLPTFSNIVKGIGEVESLQLLSLYQIGNLTGAIFFAWILTKVDASSLLISNGVIGITSLYMIINSTYIYTSVFSMGLVMSVMFSLALNIIGQLFREDSGKATGFIGTSAMSAGMITVYISGKLAEEFGIEMVFSLALYLLLTGIILSIIFKFILIKLGGNR